MCLNGKDEKFNQILVEIGNVKGSRAQELRRQRDPTFHQDVFQCRSEVRVWKKNFEHKGYVASKGIKGRKIKKTNCDQTSL